MAKRQRYLGKRQVSQRATLSTLDKGSSLRKDMDGRKEHEVTTVHPDQLQVQLAWGVRGWRRQEGEVQETEALCMKLKPLNNNLCLVQILLDIQYSYTLRRVSTDISQHLLSTLEGSTEMTKLCKRFAIQLKER